MSDKKRAKRERVLDTKLMETQMKVVFNRLRTLGLRKVFTVILAAIAFVFVPAFSQNASLQAQAVNANAQGEYNPVTPDTVKRIQQKAEDLGNSAERPIGETGLKNIKKLGENIPETLDLKARQTRAAFSDEPNKKEAMDRAQKQAEAAARN